MLISSTSRIRKKRLGHILVLCSLFICAVSIFSCATSNPVSHTITKDEPAVAALKEKYAGILHVEKEKIKDISLYQMIDAWESVKDSNVNKQGSLNMSFVQYLYELKLKTKLPGKMKELCEAKKTYLFKDCHFLEEGDLVFFVENTEPDKEVGFYLDKDVFVAADKKGKLCFHSLQDSITDFHVIANAKIIRDKKKELE